MDRSVGLMGKRGNVLPGRAAPEFTNRLLAFRNPF
jgi:hypothetical protein